MKQLKVLLVVAVLSLTMAVSSAARADGFMSKAPTVGTSVTFDVHTEVTMGEEEGKSSESEAMISCVGKEDTDDGPAYWIELKARNDAQQIMTYKLLIGEDAFAAGSNPFAAVIRGYVKREFEDKPRDLEGTEEGMMVEYLLSPIAFYEKLEGDETETIKVEALDGREFQCKARKGHGEHELFDGGWFVTSDGQLWLNDDVPFGVVKAKIEFEWDLDFGEEIVTGVSNVVVKKIETKGVKSLLPDAK